jgi:hypothetical protein
MSTYSVSLAARTPASSGAPTLTEVDRLVVKSFNFVEELNRPGTAQLTCVIGSLSSAVKTRLANLAAFPSEAWVYRDSVLLWAGEILTPQINDQDLVLPCSGLLGYTFRMGVTTDLVYSSTDQFTIAKGLIDSWQGLSYGNYGLVTSGIGSSGILRDRTYLAVEGHNIGTRLQELGAVQNGFDIYVDPVSRAVQLSYPQRGIDLTASIVVDRLNVDSASVAMSVAPDDLVTDAYVTGTGQDISGTQIAISSQASNSTLRTSYGRSWGFKNFDGVTVQSTLDEAAAAYQAARSGQLFQPGVSIIPRVGMSPGDFHVGDTLSYSYDAGLGLQSGSFRVAKINTAVDASGKERMTVDFV